MLPICVELRPVCLSNGTNAQWQWLEPHAHDRIGGPVGVGLCGSVSKRGAWGNRGWIEEIYVRPKARGTGIGGLLLRAAIERGQSLGWRALELEVVAGHERAAPLHQSHGFERNARTRFTRLLLP